MQLSICLILLVSVSAVNGKKKKPSVKTTTTSSSSSGTSCSAAAWSVADRQGILDNHNTLRSKIAKGIYVARTDKKPPAKDMETMVREGGREEGIEIEVEGKIMNIPKLIATNAE